jgi:hypothetical protein
MSVVVECLCCGEHRLQRPDPSHRVSGADSCPRCGYVGWAPAGDLSESTRRALREHPPARRRRLLRVA